MSAEMRICETPMRLGSIRRPAFASTGAESSRRCSVTPWSVETVSAGLYCDGYAHVRRLADGVETVSAGLCPEAARAALAAAAAKMAAEDAQRQRQRVESEARRLAGPLKNLLRCRDRLHVSCPCADFVRSPWSHYDSRRCKNGVRAVEALQRFAAGEVAQVYLWGSKGTGKTHLIVASHFAALARGVWSEYVTSDGLRTLFEDRAAFDPKRSGPAQERLDALRQAAVIHLDELGEGAGDTSGRFYLGLKGLVDSTLARFAVATCKEMAALYEHPDVTPLLVSRFCQDAEVISFKGEEDRRGVRQ